VRARLWQQLRNRSQEKSGGYLPFSWRTTGDFLQLEEKVFRNGQPGTSPFERVGGRKPQIKAYVYETTTFTSLYH